MQQDERSSARRLLGPGPAVIARRVAFFVAVVALWEILGRMHLWPEYLFPSPTGVARALVLGFEEQQGYRGETRASPGPRQGAWIEVGAAGPVCAP